MRRCFLCRADMLGPTERGLVYPGGRARGFAIACGSCGALMEAGAEPDACRADLAARLAQADFEPDPDGAYGLDLYTLRTAATAWARGARARDAEGLAELRAPHGTRAGRAALSDLGPGGAPVSLGVICRADEVAAVLAGLGDHAGWCDDAVLLVDAAASPPRPVAAPGFPSGGVRVAARPLAGDFAGQRNALQGLARRAWMLQLDADEHLAPEAGHRLPALAGLAEEGGAVSVGLPRANRVDGVLCDVCPDVQYRLNRAEVRYAGRVHERPAIGWQQGFITLHGMIEHRLTAAHVRTRSRRYEALDPGRGRPEEEAALLRPYRD